MQVSFDPFSAAHRDDPYPKYRELRDRAPVHGSPETGVLCVSRWEDVMLVLENHDELSRIDSFLVRGPRRLALRTAA